MTDLFGESDTIRSAFETRYLRELLAGIDAEVPAPWQVVLREVKVEMANPFLHLGGSRISGTAGATKALATVSLASIFWSNASPVPAPTKYTELA